MRLGAPAEAGWLGSIPSDDPADPRPFLLVGMRTRFAPITIKAVRAARRAVAAALRIDVDDIEEAGDELSRELIRRGLLEWEGVEDADGTVVAPQERTAVLDEDGLPALGDDGNPVTEAMIEVAMRDPTIFEAADRVYVRPWSDRELEKNGFAGSRNGTSVTPAKATATASAITAPTGDASPTPKATAKRRGKAART